MVIRLDGIVVWLLLRCGYRSCSTVGGKVCQVQSGYTSINFCGLYLTFIANLADVLCKQTPLANEQLFFFVRFAQEEECGLLHTEGVQYLNLNNKSIQ